MRKIVLSFFPTALFALLLFLLPSCSDDNYEDLIGNWFKVGSFEGKARSSAITFTIDKKAYVVSGFDGNDDRVRLKDAWEFNSETNVWIEVASLPYGSDTCWARSSSVGFSINGKGYICTGYTDNYDYLNDLWEFDPTTNTWTKKASFPGSARYGATAFTVGGEGYVVGGYDGNYLQDVYAYNPTTESWTKKVSIPEKRRFATSFVINDIAYVVSGENNGKYLDDLYAYDPTADSWTKKRDIGGTKDNLSYDDDYHDISRENAATIVINNKAYLATGDAGSLLSAVWMYDPTTDLWEQKTSFEGASRNNAIGMTVNNRGFILLGKTSSDYRDDIWEFFPYEDYEEDD